MKYDAKLPGITGAVGLVIANTLIALEEYHPGKYPMDFIRLHLMLYGINRNMRKRFRDVCFTEPFVGLQMDDMVIPVLPSVAAYHGLEKPVYFRNAKGKIILIDMSEKTRMGEVIRELYENTIDMDNKQLFEYLKDITLSYIVSGRIISI